MTALILIALVALFIAIAAASTSTPKETKRVPPQPRSLLPSLEQYPERPPEPRSSGFDPTKPSILYYARINTPVPLFMVGITNN